MWKQILKTTAVAGSLDIIAACVQAYLSKGVAPGTILKYIASGIFGKEAFSGGFEFLIFGLFIHFLIVFICALTYFLVYPKLRLLQKSVFLNSFIIAVIAWAITTRIIIPLSKIQLPPFNLSKVLIAISILYFCIGLPIAGFTKQFYSKSLNGDRNLNIVT
jgi:hypothetical protein